MKAKGRQSQNSYNRRDINMANLVLLNIRVFSESLIRSSFIRCCIRISRPSALRPSRVEERTSNLRIFIIDRILNGRVNRFNLTVLYKSLIRFSSMRCRIKILRSPVLSTLSCGAGTVALNESVRHSVISNYFWTLMICFICAICGFLFSVSSVLAIFKEI